MTAWFAVLGACAGSFLNVVIYRLPRGFALNLPSRSACPSCKRRLSWLENVPLASWLALRARCRGCGARIPARYPLVELLCAALFLAVYRAFGLSVATPYYCLLATALLAITFIDLDFRIIPDAISLPGIAVGVLASAWVEGHGVIPALEGAALGGVLFWGLGRLYEKARGREGLGLGDVKLLAMIGAFLGPRGVAGTIVISSLAGTVVGLTVMLAQRKDMKMAIPYGPFLAIGALATLFWGDHLAFRYLP